jgi:hypothetical protein
MNEASLVALSIVVFGWAILAQSTTLNVGWPTCPAPTGEVELPGCAVNVGSMHPPSPQGHHDDSTGVGDRAAPG